MPTKPYNNKEYIDWLTLGNNAAELVDEGADKVTPPTKMPIRDMALLVAGVFNGAQLVVEYSPDEMETAEADLDPLTMTWFNRPDGVFTAADTTFQTYWENMDAAEGWIRFRIIGAVAETNLKVMTRPRVEQVIS